MIEDVLATVRSVAHGWTEEAHRRKAVTAVDPVADTMSYCASELGSILEQIDQDTEWLTPAEYARQYPLRTRPSVQTVRNWCRSGRLHAVVGEKGEYKIRRGDRVKPRRRARRPA